MAEEDIVKILKRRNNVRALLSCLHKDPIVNRVDFRATYIRVRFKTGIPEIWHRHLADDQKVIRYYIPDRPLEGRDLEIKREFPYDQFDPDESNLKKLFKISYKEYKKASFYNQRMAIHRLICQIHTEGWEYVPYPHQFLVNDFKNMLRDFENRRFYSHNKLWVYTRYASRNYPGKDIVASKTEWGREYDHILRNPFRLYRVIRNLLNHGKDITRRQIFNFVPHIYKYRMVPYVFDDYNTFISPCVYKEIIRIFHLENSVVADPYPDNGVKAIACISEGCNYHCPKPFTELADFLKAEIYPLNEDHYDCVFLDYTFRPNDSMLDDFNYWKQKADFIVTYHPSEVRFPYKPAMVINTCSRIIETTGRTCLYVI